MAYFFLNIFSINIDRVFYVPYSSTFLGFQKQILTLHVSIFIQIVVFFYVSTGNNNYVALELMNAQSQSRLQKFCATPESNLGSANLSRHY